MADDGPSARPTVRDPAPAPFARDAPDRTRSSTGSFRTRRARPHAIRHRLLSHATRPTARDPALAPFVRDQLSSRRVRHRLLSHATTFMARDPAPAPFVRDHLYGTRSGDRHDRTRRPFFVRRCLAVRICPDMSGYVRICPDMSGYAGICPMMSRCRNRPATAVRAESGPTPRLSRAAERAMIKRHGPTQE